MQITLSAEDFGKFERVYNVHGIKPVSVKTGKNTKTVSWHDYIETKSHEVQKQWTDFEIPRKMQEFANSIEPGMEESQQVHLGLSGGRAAIIFCCNDICNARCALEHLITLVNELEMKQVLDRCPF